MSINERKHPGIRETPLDFLSSYEQKKFQKFRELLSPDFDTITDYTLYRFLKQNTFYTTPAEKQFRAYIAWREAKHLNVLPLAVPRKQAVQSRITPHAYHGHDKDGRPLYMEKTGKIDCLALVNESVLSTEEYLDGHVWGIENLMRLCFEQSKVLGRRVENFTSIIDMEGLSLNHRMALPRLNQAMSLDAQYYPLLIGKLYILHTPFLAPLVYSAVSPFVPKDVRDRMYVLKNNAALLEYFDSDQLPVELGGSCRLHGGVVCVREDGYDPSMSPRHGGDAEALRELHPEEEEEDVNVPVVEAEEDEAPTLQLKRDSFQQQVQPVQQPQQYVQQQPQQQPMVEVKRDTFQPVQQVQVQQSQQHYEPVVVQQPQQYVQPQQQQQVQYVQPQQQPVQQVQQVQYVQQQHPQVQFVPVTDLKLNDSFQQLHLQQQPQQYVHQDHVDEAAKQHHMSEREKRSHRAVV